MRLDLSSGAAEGSQRLCAVQRRATAHLHPLGVGNGHRYFCSHAAVFCPEKAGTSPRPLSCGYCRCILGHGRRRDQRKIHRRRDAGRSQWSGDKHFLRTLDLAEINAGERAAVVEKPRRRRLLSQMSAIHTAGRPEIPLVSAFPSVSMRSSALWAQTVAAKTTIGKLIAGLFTASGWADIPVRQSAKA